MQKMVKTVERRDKTEAKENENSRKQALYVLPLPVLLETHHFMRNDIFIIWYRQACNSLKGSMCLAY